VFVKICGITTEEDALLAVAMGADAIGFIFAPSERQVAPGHVRDIVRRLPPDILTIGVFRDEAPSRVVEVVNTVGLHGAQLHGHETPEIAQEIRPGVRFLVQAFTAGDPMLDRAGEYHADALLIDAHEPGSGQAFDWSLADRVPPGHRVILAGGLTPENVATGIERVRPWGVDVATGVEASPGHKDPRLVRAFVEAARAASPHDPALDLDLELGDGPFDWQEDGA
jgi:phosphoribosylanthranilate isomerase